LRWTEEERKNLVRISASMLEVGRHVSEMEPLALLDEVLDVVAFDVNVFRGGHALGGEGNATLVVFTCKCSAFDRAFKTLEKMTEDHSFMWGGGEGHVLGLCGGEGDNVLKFIAPRAAMRHNDVSGARAAVNTVV
jgi:hypothetical protein